LKTISQSLIELATELQTVTRQRDALLAAARKAARLIESLPDFTFGEVLDGGNWDGFCDSTGTDVYGMSEGKFDSDDSAMSMMSWVSDELSAAIRDAENGGG
jgi:hypothetical protein